jgi:DNA-directed RNA polymerase subunit D
MKVEILEMNEYDGKFTVEGVHPYFVNAMRRVLLAEVPKLAIDTVTIYDNTSSLFDEIIAHRLGLVPIPTDPSTLNLAGQVDDEGNPSYLVRFTLTKEGPGTVYSGDLECEDKYFTIKDDKIPIVELLEGQRLILEATAILGIGTTHAKWQVCSGVGYKYYPSYELDNKKITKEQAVTAAALTPGNILEEKGGKLIVNDEININRADDAVLMTDGGLQVTYDDRKFLFRFETDGSLKAEDALLKGVEILKERFQAFSASVGEL